MVAGFGQPCPGMPNVLQNIKSQISLGKVELFCLFVYLHVVTYPGKLHCYHIVLVGYSAACPEFY